MKTEQEIKDQLQAKEQECEELKIQVCRCSEGWGKAECEKNLYQQIEQEEQEKNFNLEMQVSKYEQALDDIERIANKREVFCEHCSNDDDDFSCEDCGYCKILDIINKAKDGE